MRSSRLLLVVSVLACLSLSACAKSCGDDGAKGSGGGTSGGASGAAGATAASKTVPKAEALAELRKNAGALEMGVRVAPFLGGRLMPNHEIYEVMLGAGKAPGNDRGFGPSGRPLARSHPMTPEQTTAVLDALAADGALDKPITTQNPVTEERHVTLWFGWGGKPQYFVVLPWDKASTAVVEDIRKSVSEAAAKDITAMQKPMPG